MTSRDGTRRARIAGWGENVYVKIPVTYTLGASSMKLVQDLAQAGRKTERDCADSVSIRCAMQRGAERDLLLCISVRWPCGRYRRDPLPIWQPRWSWSSLPGHELIWASPRELLNIFQADAVGCHIITVTSDILKKCTWSARICMIVTGNRQNVSR